MKKILFLFFLFIFLSGAQGVFAHQPRIIYLAGGDIQISNPEISQAFYDDLKGSPRDYFITSDKDFDLYINLLIPASSNPGGRYSAKVFLLQESLTEPGQVSEQQIALLDGENFDWQEFYEPFGRDYYYKGPELDQRASAGKYKIEVFANGAKGKYVLAVGKTEAYDVKSILNIYWQIPFLKITFFKTSVLQFFLTPFGIVAIGLIGALIILIALINYLINLVQTIIKHNMAKTLLLTSAGMQMKDEIIALLQKPAYDITVAFINTAAKPQEDVFFMENNLRIMNEMGFNVEQVDIDGKTENELFKIFQLKDIIFVEGGNAFYLLNAMRRCNFEKVIKKILKQGKVYIGASAGSIVAGKTIQTAGWLGEENISKSKNLKGLNLVPFDIFPHYGQKYDEIIKQKIKNPKKRWKKLRILTDDQAILVQGKEASLIGKGEPIVI